MKQISTAELKQKMQSGPLAVFDVRGDVQFEQGHIPGAKTAPLGSLVFRVAHVMNPDSEVVVYASGDDGLAQEAAERLEDLGLRNVHVYADGVQGWRARGLPVVESVQAKVITQGAVQDVRPLVVDRERAYGGAFSGDPVDAEGAGG
jgi:rhodanese-related sulfurtransferase